MCSRLLLKTKIKAMEKALAVFEGKNLLPWQQLPIIRVRDQLIIAKLELHIQENSCANPR